MWKCTENHCKSYFSDRENKPRMKKYGETHNKANTEVICQQVRCKTYNAHPPTARGGLYFQSLVKIQIFPWTYGRACAFEFQASAKLQLIFASQANHYCATIQWREKSPFLQRLSSTYLKTNIWAGAKCLVKDFTHPGKCMNSVPPKITN